MDILIAHRRFTNRAQDAMDAGIKSAQKAGHLGRGRRRREGGGETDQRWVWAVNGEKKVIVGYATMI